jgi:hypothetical protein
MCTEVNLRRDDSVFELWIGMGYDGYITGHKTQKVFLVELEQGFLFSRCL